MSVVFLTSQTPLQRRVGQIPNVLDGPTTDLAVKLAHERSAAAVAISVNPPYRHCPWAVVQSNKVYLAREVFVVRSGIAARQINAIRWRTKRLNRK